MTNPTCPQCQQPLTCRNATLFMGQVAILLECDNGHQTVEIVESSRFIDTDCSYCNGRGETPSYNIETGTIVWKVCRCQVHVPLGIKLA